MSGHARRSSVSEADRRRFRAAILRSPRGQGCFERIVRCAFRVWRRLVSWRLDIEIRGRLPAAAGRSPGAGCLVVGAPHRAWVEPFLLLVAWPADAARLVWLADGRTATGSWWRRRLLPRIGVIPIQGDYGGPRAYLELVNEALAAGVAVAVFPEKGPPSAAGRTRVISPGFAYMARRSGAPVVPVVIAGTHHIVRGSSFSVSFLETIEVGEPDPDPFAPTSRPLAQALGRRYEELIAAELPIRNAITDARRPSHDRWTWLGTLFR